jgi:hypothetical protein
MAIPIAVISENMHINLMVISIAIMCGCSIIKAIAYSTSELAKKGFAKNGAIIVLCSKFIAYGYLWMLTHFRFW